MTTDHTPLRVSRREALKSGLLAGAAVLAPSIVMARQESRAPARPGALRFAHLTDMHVQPERRAGEGYVAALKSLQNLSPRPHFIITGGDHVMDVFNQDAARSKVVWELYHQIMNDNWDGGVYPCIGNHDVWAWGKKQQDIDPATPSYGKATAIEQLRLASPYHSFDAGGWHFICLDNIARREFGYLATLDEEQADWLERDLKSAGGKPVCLTTHIPITSVCALMHPRRYDEKITGYRVSDALMHANAAALVDLLRRHNVRLCLSGHIHMIDRVDFRGITFICDGAVSGAWWKGPHLDFPEGYGVIDIWPDGTFEHQYMTFGWEAQES